MHHRSVTFSLPRDFLAGLQNVMQWYLQEKKKRKEKESFHESWMELMILVEFDITSMLHI